MNDSQIRRARRRIILALFASQGAFSAANIAGFTVMSIIAADLGGSAAFAGLPTAAFLAGRALGGYPFGRLMDAVGRRRGLATGYIVGMGGTLLAALAVMGATFAGFLAATLILGLARAAADQSRFAAAEALPARQRGQTIGIIVFAGTIGAVGGPFLVGASTDLASAAGVTGLAGPWAAGAVLAALAAGLTFAFVRPEPRTLGPPIPPPSGAGPTTDPPPSARSLREVLGSRPARLAVISMVVGQGVMTMVMTITPLHMHQIQYEPVAISVAMSVHTLGMFGLSPFTGQLADRYGRAPIIALGAAQLVVAGALALAATSLASILPLMFLLGYGWNFCYVAGSSMLTDALRPDERGRVQGVSESLVAAAAAVGALGTGPVFAAGEMTWIGVASLVASLALVVTLGRYSIARRPLPA